MFRALRAFGFMAVVLTASFMSMSNCAVAQTTATKARKEAPPTRFEKDILAFEAKDAVSSPPQGAIVCIGSSTMRGWHKTIEKDLAPLTVIPRGFGGSRITDATYYADRIVTPYKPRAVVLYEGDNDIAGGATAEKVRDNVSEFVKKVRRQLPDVRIYCISVKPSPSRWDKWPESQKANQLMKEMCSSGKNLIYVDTASVMLGADGKPKPEIFLKDKLHMNEEGYRLWTSVVKPLLMEKEAAFEKK